MALKMHADNHYHDNHDHHHNNDIVSYDAITAPNGVNNPDRLHSNYVWDNDKNGITLYYNFWEEVPSYYDSDDEETQGFNSFTAPMQSVTRDILGLVEGYTNITFAETNSQTQTYLGFAQSSLTPNAGGWAYYPHYHPKGGDVWTSRKYVSDTSLDQGGYAYFVLLHEIGHALGLQHSFSAGFEGIYNTEQHSVMAYDWSIWGSVFASSYQLADIAALQTLYGANMEYNSGDTVYTLEIGRAYTIWDGGGHDTLDGSHLSDNLVISLDDGTFSSVGLIDNIAVAYQADIENANAGAGHDTIYGNELANVINGNNGNDMIFGSAGDDFLHGGNGDDLVLYGLNIAQFLFTFVDSATVQITDQSGAYGMDTLVNIEQYSFNGVVYDRGILQSMFDPTPHNVSQIVINLYSHSGEQNQIVSDVVENTDDVIALDRTESTLFLSTIDDDTLKSLHIYASDEADIVDARETDTYNKVYGYHGDDILYGGDGYNVLFGEMGDDVLYGGLNRDRLDGGQGNDVLHGGASHDSLYGGAGNDVLHGGAGKDTLYGHDGMDVLIGGAGKDFLYGGAGSDVFVLDHVDGAIDQIRDFTLSGDEKDALNIADILHGYDAGDDVIGDFVALSAQNTNQTAVLVNQDGLGDDWQTVAMVQGAGVGNVTVDELLGTGQLILDFSRL